jgi:hypothetical protein
VFELGDDRDQKKVSLLEAKEVVEDKLLEEGAKVLKVPGAIRNFDEEAAFSIINNTYHNTSNYSSTMVPSSVNFQPTFNPMDKIVELYKALFQSGREKNELLLSMLKNSKVLESFRLSDSTG